MAQVANWLQYFETRYEKPIQLGLSRIKAAVDTLSLHNLGIPVITVAGTNGKGSTVEALKAIYMAAGYQVGSYTSPHLFEFNERIKINNQCISDKALIDIFKIIDAQSQQLTYFEVSTLAALLYFKQHKLDVIILEVGMGGRLDATNCIDADLAIITTIDLDHEAYLGHTVEAIGFEKAGIFRKNQHAIFADLYPPQSILQQAKINHIDLMVLNKDYHYQIKNKQFHFSSSKSKSITIPMPNIHPQALAAAMMVSIQLGCILPVSMSEIQNSSQYIKLEGRRQWLNTAIPTLVDVAHNQQAALSLAQYIQALSIEGKVHAVFSSLQDKPLCGLIDTIHQQVDYWYITGLEDARAADKQQLIKACEYANTYAPATLYESPVAAYESAARASNSGDVMIVFGSFVLVSAVMRTTRFKQGEIS